MANPILYPNICAVRKLTGLTGATLPQTLTLLPASQPAGLYQILNYYRVRTAAAVGRVDLTLNWTDPLAGASSFLLTQFLLTATTIALPSAVSIVSDGSAITLVATLSTAITGSPVFDIYGSARPAAFN